MKVNHWFSSIAMIADFAARGSGRTITIRDGEAMGLVYLYPVDASGGKEEPSLGMACSRTR